MPGVGRRWLFYSSPGDLVDTSGPVPGSFRAQPGDAEMVFIGRRRMAPLAAPSSLTSWNGRAPSAALPIGMAARNRLICPIQDKFDALATNTDFDWTVA